MREIDVARPASGRNADLIGAFVTLSRAADFVAVRLHPATLAERGCRVLPAEDRYRARMLGNALRELDRFLKVLVEIAARCRGIGIADDRHNMAKTLCDIGLFAPSCADDRRLRALGRARDCLFHLHGHVRRGDHPDHPVLTVGWRIDRAENTPLLEVGVGSRLVLNAVQLADIAAFYRRLATDLVRFAGE